MPTPLHLFFGFSGRINRKQFWLGVLGIAIAALAALAIALWSNLPLLSIPLFLAIFVATYALAVKRLHDHNKSGWWTLIFLWAPGVLDRLSDKVVEGGAAWWILVPIGSAITAWALVELGFRRGTDGENEYGPDPLKTHEVTPAAV